MGFRVFVTLLVTFFGVSAAFFDAFYGLIAYAFWSYTYPEKNTWGLLPIQGLSYVTGVVVILTTFLQKKRLFIGNPKNTAMIIFWAFCLVSIFTAGLEEYSTWQFKFFSRVILITLIITVLVDDLKRFRYYLWAIVIFLGLIAAKSGIFGFLGGFTGGARSGFGGLIGERNYMAVILCTVIPIVYHMTGTMRKKWQKLSLLIILFGDLLALQLTYSRAGFIGFLAIAIYIFAKSKRKILWALLVAIAVSLLGAYFVQKLYVERVSTIKVTAERWKLDASAAGRLLAWKSAMEMIKDRPIMGVGFYRSQAEMEKYPDAKTGIALADRAIHNTILQVGAEMGLPALFLYLGIFFAAYRTLGRIKKKTMKEPSSGEIRNYASMLQVAFVGFFVPAFFVNAAFIDISWHLVGLTIALEHITNKETDDLSGSAQIAHV